MVSLSVPLAITHEQYREEINPNRLECRWEGVDWREELNLQPAVYKSVTKGLLNSLKIWAMPFPSNGAVDSQFVASTHSLHLRRSH